MGQPPPTLDYATQVGEYTPPERHALAAALLMMANGLLGVAALFAGLLYVEQWDVALPLAICGVLLCWAVFGCLSRPEPRLGAAALLVAVALASQLGAMVVASSHWHQIRARYPQPIEVRVWYPSQATDGLREEAFYATAHDFALACAVLPAVLLVYVLVATGARRRRNRSPVPGEP